jgi:hypothetical protein
MSGPAEVLDAIGRKEIESLEIMAQLMLEYRVLSGPASSTQESELRERGWDPGASAAIAKDRAKNEEATAQRFSDDPALRRKTRDVVALLELKTEMAAFAKALESRRAFGEELVGDRAGLEAMIQLMPSLLVTIELKAALHRNSATKWDSNAMFDIDAMSVAVPYADVVVCDAETHSMLTRRHLGEQLGTVILRSPDRLAEVLASDRWIQDVRNGAFQSCGIAGRSAPRSSRMWP